MLRRVSRSIPTECHVSQPHLLAAAALFSEDGSVEIGSLGRLRQLLFFARNGGGVFLAWDKNGWITNPGLPARATLKLHKATALTQRPCVEISELALRLFTRAGMPHVLVNEGTQKCYPVLMGGPLEVIQESSMFAAIQQMSRLSSSTRTRPATSTVFEPNSLTALGGVAEYLDVRIEVRTPIDRAGQPDVVFVDSDDMPLSAIAVPLAESTQLGIKTFDAPAVGRQLLDHLTKRQLPRCDREKSNVVLLRR